MIFKLFNRRNGGIPWGGYRVPRSDAVLHFLVLGKTRSGKSLTMKALMRHALERGEAALIYDASGDIIPDIARYASDSNPLMILNPFDSRCWYWAIEEDIQSDSDAEAFAAALVPEPKSAGQSTDEFFRGNAAGVLAAVLTVLSRRRRENSNHHWNLRDAVNLALDRDRLISFLRHYSDTEAVLGHLRSERTLSDVLATVQVNIRPLKPIAASWNHVESANPERRFSFDDWARTGKGIVVLGTNEKSPAPLVSANRLVFERACGALLSRKTRFNQSPDAPLTWVFIDECALMGRDLPRLSELVSRGAKFGVALVLATQSIEGFRQAYGGPDAADGILAQTHHLAVFNSSYVTAEWCSQQFGHADRLRASYARSHGENGSDSTTVHSQREFRVPPEAVQDLPLVRPSKPLVGFYTAPSYQAGVVYRQSLPWRHIIKLQPAPNSEPALVEMPPHALQLGALAGDDLSRLGLHSGVDLLDFIDDEIGDDEGSSQF